MEQAIQDFQVGETGGRGERAGLKKLVVRSIWAEICGHDIHVYVRLYRLYSETVILHIYIILHYITLHYIILHYITLHYITLLFVWVCIYIVYVYMDDMDVYCPFIENVAMAHHIIVRGRFVIDQWRSVFEASKKHPKGWVWKLAQVISGFFLDVIL